MASTNSGALRSHFSQLTVALLEPFDRFICPTALPPGTGDDLSFYISQNISFCIPQNILLPKASYQCSLRHAEVSALQLHHLRVSWCNSWRTLHVLIASSSCSRASLTASLSTFVLFLGVEMMARSAGHCAECVSLQVTSHCLMRNPLRCPPSVMQTSWSNWRRRIRYLHCC